MDELRLTLYSGPHCSLCDKALELVSPRVPAGARLEIVDITSDLELKKRYGWTIPVLRREDSGAELSWPFDAAELEGFLAPA